MRMRPEEVTLAIEKLSEEIKTSLDRKWSVVPEKLLLYNDLLKSGVQYSELLEKHSVTLVEIYVKPYV